MMDVLYQWAYPQLISCHILLGNRVLSGTEIQHPLFVKVLSLCGDLEKKDIIILQSLTKSLAFAFIVYTLRHLLKMLLNYK